MLIPFHRGGKMPRATILFLLFVASLLLPAFTRAEIPHQISFQGKLDSSGVAVPNGNYQVTFRIYDDSSAGTVLWNESQTIATKGGLFSTSLGQVTPLPDSTFSASGRFLGIQVGSHPEMPHRFSISSAAYSFHSLATDSGGAMADSDWAVSNGNVYRLSGNVGIGTDNPIEKLEVRNGNIMIRNQFGDPELNFHRNIEGDLPGQGRIRVTHTTTDQAPYSGSIHLEPFWYNGSGYDFRQNVFAVDASGRVGIGTSIPDATLHVAGDVICDGNAGFGTRTPRAKIELSGSMLVPGSSWNQMIRPPIGNTRVTGEISGSNIINPDYDDGFLRLSAGGGNAGDAKSFIDLSGFSTVPDMYNNIVLGTRNTERMRIDQAGNVGIGTVAPENKVDIRGITSIADDGAWPNTNLYGSFGVTRANISDNECYISLVKQAVVPWGIGIDAVDKLIFGIASSDPIKTIPSPFLVIQPWTGNVGIGTGSPTAKLHVVGDFRVEGNMCVTGQKNAIVPTSKGMTKVYSEESSECWFTDYGEAHLVNGKAHIDIDPLFLETVTIDNQNPMQVYLQEYDESNGLTVKRGASCFDVIEKAGGKSDASFSYRIVAKRKGQENARLQTVGIASK
jgi:hypothetical protein